MQRIMPHRLRLIFCGLVCLAVTAGFAYENYDRESTGAPSTTRVESGIENFQAHAGRDYSERFFGPAPNHRLSVPDIQPLVVQRSAPSEESRLSQLSSFGGQFQQRGRRPRRRPSRDEFATWQVDSEFEDDIFTFVRIQYDSYGSFGWWDRWDNDYPDSEWNFSYRLQQLTSMKVAPNSKVMRLTDPELFNYPFIYMAGVQKMVLSESEKTAMRRYLLNGGFVMMDDFWAPNGWNNIKSQMSDILPDQEPTELSLKHPIFHIVYDLKELPQVVDIKTWSDGYKFEHRHGDSGGDEAPHFWAYFDDDRRMVALLCHNNDLGDGWEREGANHEYFRQFSEKQSYPMGINIVIYAMTH